MKYSAFWLLANILVRSSILQGRLSLTKQGLLSRPSTRLQPSLPELCGGFPVSASFSFSTYTVLIHSAEVRCSAFNFLLKKKSFQQLLV